MKKTSILLSALLLQLTASYAQQQAPSPKVHRARTLLQSRLNDVLTVNTLRARDAQETPLAQSRRIIKQEYFTALVPDAIKVTDYGYTSPDKGQEFHPSMIGGFPMDISFAGNADRVFFPEELYSDWSTFVQYNFPIHTLGAEIVIDSLNTYEEGNLVYAVAAQRGANNRIDVLTKSKQNNIVKAEKFYTNDLLTKVDQYYGENLSALNFDSRRLITYDNTRKIIADTLFYYNIFNIGAIDEIIVFTYNYNSNGDVSEMTLSSDIGDSAHIVVDYYADHRFKKYTISTYSPGGDFQYMDTDSVAYASNGFIATKKTGVGYEDSNGALVFAYNTLDLTYNGNLLDTVKINNAYETGEIVYKYHYSIDNNPDSLLIYYDAGSPAEERVIFHYEPYNTTSVKQIARNNNFSIYPNPIGATMNVYNKVALKDRKATIMITDIKGARIWSVEQALTQGANQINIPAGLSAGTYLISITADNSVYTQKVIKQ